MKKLRKYKGNGENRDKQRVARGNRSSLLNSHVKEFENAQMSV